MTEEEMMNAYKETTCMCCKNTTNDTMLCPECKGYCFDCNTCYEHCNCDKVEIEGKA